MISVTDASVPITLAGKVYQLRYTYPDFKAMEKALGVGYVHFLRDEIFRSLNAQEVYLWRGLKQQNPDVTWVPVFPATPEGQEQAGALLWEHLQQSGNLAVVIDAVFDAFTTTGPWKKSDPKKPEPEKTKKEPQKNLKT